MRAPLLDLIAANAKAKTASGVAKSIARLIGRGSIAPGQRLPTVRAVAAALNVSLSTVAEAWRLLQTQGVISTDGRRGTRVRKRSTSAGARHWHVPVTPGTLSLDLSTGTPDAALLPPLGPALSRIPLDLPVTSYLDEPVIPELEEELRRRWPFPPEELTVVDGAQDALDRIVATVVRFGDPVLVEDPGFPPRREDAR